MSQLEPNTGSTRPYTRDVRAEAYRMLGLELPHWTVAKLLRLTPTQLAAYVKDWRTQVGSPERHHAEKSELIDQVLEGKQNLKIYEVFGGLGTTGKDGVCYAAYKKYGEVVSRRSSDGDYLDVTRRSVGLCAERYDVVDVDGYGGPERALMAGAMELLSDNGYLFLTWPIQGGYHRYPATQHYALAFHGTTAPKEEHFNCFVERTAAQFGRRAHLLSHQMIGPILRQAWVTQKITWPKAKLIMKSRVEHTREMLHRHTAALARAASKKERAA